MAMTHAHAAEMLRKIRDDLRPVNARVNADTLLLRGIAFDLKRVADAGFRTDVMGSAAILGSELARKHEEQRARVLSLLHGMIALVGDK